jgi:predicted acyl esterase
MKVLSLALGGAGILSASSNEKACFDTTTTTATTDANTGASARSYVYDPSQPTPAVGGASFDPTNCGQRVLQCLI